MRILKVCASTAWGGLEISMVQTALGLRERGHEVFPVCVPGSPIEERLRAAGLPPLLSNIWGKFHPLQAWRLARYIRRHRIDLVHTDHSRDLFTLVPALRLAGGVPLVMHKHIGTSGPKKLFVHHYMYHRVDFVIAISEVIRANLLATHPLREDQVGIIHHGIDVGRFQPDPAARARLRAELGVADHECLVGTVGRLQEPKGHLDFMEVARRVLPGHPDTRFVIVGTATAGAEEEAAAIEQAATAPELGGRVIMAGFRTDVPDLLGAMDLFLFPSYAEAFGLVIIEAMAMHLPVVAYGCDGVPDIVADRGTGLLVPLHDRDALTGAVAELLNDPERRLALGRAGRARVEAKFTDEHFYGQLEDLYGRLIAQHRGSTAARNR